MGSECARCGTRVLLWSNGLCPDCTQLPHERRCPECDGHGEIAFNRSRDTDPQRDDIARCHLCNGSGIEYNGTAKG